MQAHTEQGATTVAGAEEWRIHLDLDPAAYPPLDSRPPFHSFDGVSAADARYALDSYRARTGSGITMSASDGKDWFYPWSVVLDLRITPMREAL